MLFHKKFYLFLITLFAILLGISFFQNKDNKKSPPNSQPKNIQADGRMKVKYPEDYTIVIVGDSMTEKLGNSDEIRSYLKNYYPNKTFEILNYGFGSTNILSVQKRLEEETFFGRAFRPILNIDFDLILIESFGNNPLSEFPLDVGLNKQNETLDKIIETLKKESPSSRIVFVATISPNKNLYGKGQVDLTPEVREKWADERIAYIKNHIKYANDHQILLINIFEKSQDENGNGKLDYLSSVDYIHPSPNGVYFISEQIAKFISENNILTP
ncbi:MAG: SGNH/GDSL hydrolase family protein [Candidatus Daviesbacteria bacterium]|nr:SGNH/GDSL hydrolase family protein [Candidatus Daviesbacteria bacterium]